MFRRLPLSNTARNSALVSTADDVLDTLLWRSSVATVTLNADPVMPAPAKLLWWLSVVMTTDPVLLAPDVIFRWPRFSFAERLFELVLLPWQTLPWDADVANNWLWAVTTEFRSSCPWQSIAACWAGNCCTADTWWLELTTLDVAGTFTGSECVTVSVSLNSTAEDVSVVVNTSRISSLIARRSSSMSLVYKYTANERVNLRPARHITGHLTHESFQAITQ